MIGGKVAEGGRRRVNGNSDCEVVADSLRVSAAKKQGRADAPSGGMCFVDIGAHQEFKEAVCDWTHAAVLDEYFGVVSILFGRSGDRALASAHGLLSSELFFPSKGCESGEGEL